MNTSDEILSALDAVAAEPSKTAKLGMLKAYCDSQTFRHVLELAYSPFRTYGVSPDRPEKSGSAFFDHLTMDMVYRLASRELTGNAAREAIASEFERLSPKSGELLWRILNKDLRAGFSESTINKACPGLIPTFPYMRCSLLKGAKVEKFDWETGVFSQEKADGMFANVNHYASGAVSIVSRQGSEFPVRPFLPLTEEVRRWLNKGTQSHGEILVRKAGVVLPREIGNGILNSVLKGGDFADDEVPIFKIWDQIPQAAVVSKGRYNMKYKDRLLSINNQLYCESDFTPLDPLINIIDGRVCHSMEEVMTHFREKLAEGKEGTVFKNPSAIWGDYTSKDQIKLKLDVVVDLRIVGVVPGNKGTKNEGRPGSLPCESEDGQLRVDVTVKNEAMRDSVEKYPHDWIGQIIAVRFNAIMRSTDTRKPHSLFLPRFVEAGCRIDKAVADTYQQICDQYESAVMSS